MFVGRIFAAALIAGLVGTGPVIDAAVADSHHKGPGPHACEKGRDKDYLDHTWFNKTMHFYVIRSSLPPQANTVRKQDRYIQRIRDAAHRWDIGDSWCDDDIFGGFNSSYEGDEGYSAANFTDETSAIDFADGRCLGGLVHALACAHTESDEDVVYDTRAGEKESAISTDIRFRRTFSWFAGKRRYWPPPNKPCPGRDLLGVAMHEMGHAVGADDLYDNDPATDPDKHDGQVMGSDGPLCTYRRRFLGRADKIMLKELYTLE